MLFHDFSSCENLKGTIYDAYVTPDFPVVKSVHGSYVISRKALHALYFKGNMTDIS